MQPNDLPQEGDLLLCLALGARAEKYFPKRAGVGPQQAMYAADVAGMTPGVRAMQAIAARPGASPAAQNVATSIGALRDFHVGSSARQAVSPKYRWTSDIFGSSPVAMVDPTALTSTMARGVDLLAGLKEQPGDREQATNMAIPSEKPVTPSDTRLSLLQALAASRVVDQDAQLAAHHRNMKEYPVNYMINPFVRDTGPLNHLGSLLSRRINAVRANPDDRSRFLAYVPGVDVVKGLIHGGGEAQSLARGRLQHLIASHGAATKQSDFLSKAQDGLNQAGDWLNQNALQPAVETVNKHVTDPISSRFRSNLGIPEGGVGGFFDRNPWAVAPLIGGGIGAGVGLLGSAGKKKKKDILGSVLQGGLLGAGAGGLAWGAREMLGHTPEQTPKPQSKSIPESPAGITPGADLRAPKPEPDLLQRKRTVLDSWGNSGGTNAFIEGPLRTAKDQYATLRMGGNLDPTAAKTYDDAYRAVTNAESNQDWTAAAQYVKKLQELNDFHSNLIGNNLKAPQVPDVVSGLGSALVPGFGGMAGATGQLGSAARPGPTPSDFSLFGRQLLKGQNGLELAAPDAQPRSMVQFANELRPAVEANNQAVNSADSTDMGDVPWYRSAAGRRSMETAGLGGLMARGSQILANRTGHRIGPDARYYNQLEKGITSPVPTRGLLGQPLRLLDAATRIGPEQANQKALTEIAVTLNNGATGKFVTPDEVGQALRDPNHALRTRVVGAIRGLGGRSGENVAATAPRGQFDLRPAADNPMFIESLQKRLVKPTAAQPQASTVPTPEPVVPPSAKPTPEDFFGEGQLSNGPTASPPASPAAKPVAPAKPLSKDQLHAKQLDDLRKQLRGDIPMTPEVTKLLTSQDGPFGPAMHNAKIKPPSGKFGPTLPVHGPTHATTASELLKKNTLGRLRSPTALGMVTGGLTPTIQSWISGERTKRTLGEQLAGAAPGGHDLGDPKVQQRLLEWFRQRQPSADEREAQLR